MNTYINKIVNYINRSNDLTELQIKKICFGLECLLGEIGKSVIYIFIFSILGLLNYFFIAFTFFCILRIFAGGLHRNSYWECFFTTLFVFSTSIYVGYTNILNNEVQTLLIVISLILIIMYAPVDHPNKPIINKDRRKKIKLYSIGVFILLVGASYLLSDKLHSTAVFALFIEALTLLLGEIDKRGKLNAKA